MMELPPRLRRATAWLCPFKLSSKLRSRCSDSVSGRITQAAGFTLVELSIVIVIIGLIVAGVTAGQSLVRQAQMQSVVNGFQKYSSAYNTFFLQYNALPGDFSNAYAFFSSNCGSNAAECNGNGNGQVEWGAAALTDKESTRLWQHLNGSGIYPNSLNGVGDATLSYIAANSPTSALSNSVYFVENVPGFAWRAGNNMQFMQTASVGNWYGIMTVSEARAIDLKIDDGIANKGKLYGIGGHNVAVGDCSARPGASGADYVISSTVKAACLLSYNLLK